MVEGEVAEFECSPAEGGWTGELLLKGILRCADRSVPWQQCRGLLGTTPQINLRDVSIRQLRRDMS